MKQIKKTQPKPTKFELERLERYFYLPGWQFQALIGSKSTIIDETFKCMQKNEHQYIEIYGLRAVRTETDEPCFANYFVKDENRVFQCSAIDQAVEMVRIIRKDHNYEDYKYNLWKTKHEQRQKIKKQKAKLKQLTAVKSKVA